jgi:hypothetical protein
VLTRRLFVPYNISPGFVCVLLGFSVFGCSHLFWTLAGTSCLTVRVTNVRLDEPELAGFASVVFEESHFSVNTRTERKAKITLQKDAAIPLAEKGISPQRATGLPQVILIGPIPEEITRSSDRGDLALQQ